MYRPAPRPLMLVSPPGVAASYRRGESLSRGFSILEAEAPMPREQRGSDGRLTARRCFAQGAIGCHGGRRRHRRSPSLERGTGGFGRGGGGGRRAGRGG